MKIKIVYLIIFSAIVCLVCYMFYTGKRENKQFLNKAYHGVISEIIVDNGSRGFPVIRIDTLWVTLGIKEEIVSHYIRTGDSIAKKPGSSTITVFRKNSQKQWMKKPFDCKD